MGTHLLPLMAFAAITSSFDEPIRSADLRETLTRARWLSLPQSRLVVNPRFAGYGTDGPGGAIADAPLGLDLAYYVGEEPVRLPGFWTWQPQAPGRTRAEVLGPEIDLVSPSGWVADGVRAEHGAGGVRIAAAGAYGSLSQTVEIDLEQTPLVRIDVPERVGNWAFKVSEGGAEADVTLIGDTGETGAFVVDVPRATGWRGKRRFALRLYAVGAGKPVTVAGVRFFREPDRLRPRAGGTAWTPHAIFSEASAGEGALRVESTVLLPDEGTVAQRLRMGRAGAGPLLLTGTFAGGTVRWDAARQTLILRGKGYRAVLAVSHPVRWRGVRATSLDWLAEEGTPSSAGAWALALDGLRPGDEVVVAARFVPASGPIEPERVKRLATAREFAKALRKQESAWDRRLAEVPHPVDFRIAAVDPLGVTPEEVRRTYYRAWAFLLAGTLPPMRENGYPYPQLPTGKPSLWGEGAPRARASAQWESFVAMQTVALVQPKVAWDAYEGLMSLVGADGSLNGEGLPSCHAQTAWVLFQATGDARRLRRVYPALRRLLLWKAADPRWIHKGATPPGQKDQQFVLYALMDMEYARRIAERLGMGEEVQFWRERREALAGDFHRWFWEVPGGPSYRLFHAPTGERSARDNAWNLTTLALPPDVLTGPERESLLRAFRAQVRSGVPFLVPGLSRFADYEGTVRGLFAYGHAEKAAQLADAAMRDVVRAGEFAEFYDQGASPRPAGVRPSVFGARFAIDGVLWHNGVVYDEGMPVLLGVSGAVGIANLRVRGEVLLEGPGLAYLRRPPTFRTERSSKRGLRWTGVLKPGTQIQLASLDANAR